MITNLSGGAIILIFMVEGARAVISFCILSAIPTKQYTVKKVSDIPVPSQDVTSQTLPGNN